ncbi:flavin reductase family protein [Longispora albida]|uniref:flavin reductase family protein n=1 Tax=Longispora albida TaxID=203523 RepID=UPI00037FB738|nr:flavin reductase family protein [Longispora albida]
MTSGTAGALATVELLVGLGEGSGALSTPDGDAARRALRRMASGVTVLTISEDGLRHGATVSALVPVSREPLLVAACLTSGSSLAGMVKRARLFSVNVLASGQGDLAYRFADPRRRPGDAQFGAERWTTDQVTGAPLLGGCLAHLSCRATDWFPAGDHDLIIAEVLGGNPGAGLPLLTFAGRLHT